MSADTSESHRASGGWSDNARARGRELEAAIQAYLADRTSTRFKVRWLDLPESTKKYGVAVEYLLDEDVITRIGKSSGSVSYRYIAPTISRGEA